MNSRNKAVNLPIASQKLGQASTEAFTYIKKDNSENFSSPEKSQNSLIGPRLSLPKGMKQKDDKQNCDISKERDTKNLGHEVTTPETNSKSPISPSQNIQLKKIEELIETDKQNLSSKSIDESYGLVEKNSLEKFGESSLYLSELEPDEKVHLAFEVPEQSSEAKEEDKQDINENNTSPKNYIKTKMEKVQQIKKTHKSGNWPEMTWNEQKELQKDLKKSENDYRLLETRAETLKKLYESYKKSCLSLESQLKKKDDEKIIDSGLIKGEDERTTRENKQTEEKEIQTEEEMIPKTEYNEAIERLNFSGVLLENALNFIGCLLEGLSHEESKEEYRARVIKIEKELEKVLIAASDFSVNSLDKFKKQ